MDSARSDDSYWSDIWANPDVASLIFQKGRIFAETQRRFLEALEHTIGSLADLAILDYGCGDGALLAPVACRERILYEPSPVYGRALLDLTTRSGLRHGLRVIKQLKDLPDQRLDLVIMHTVAQYISPSALQEILTELRRSLAHGSRGVLIADVPHPKPLVDALGALFGHSATVLQVLMQILRLSTSGYSAGRLYRHSPDDLAQIARATGYECLPIRARLFNRARSMVLLNVVESA